MKKYLLTLATALLALAASAETWQSTGYGEENYEAGGPSTGNNFPFYSGYSNTLCQLLYTPDQLVGLTKVENGQSQDALISALDFFYVYDDNENQDQEEADIEFTVKVSALDAVSFPVTDNKFTWFTNFDESVIGKGSIHVESDWSFMQNFIPVHVEFDKPLLYTNNKSLLLTFESTTENPTYYNVVCGFVGYSVNTSNRVSCSLTKPNLDFDGLYATPATEGDGKTLLSIQLTYTPQAGAAASLANITNATIGIEKATLKNSDVNVLTFDFDIEDEADGGPYEILLGTTSLGTTESKHVHISYLEYKDYTLSINPTKEGVVGGTYDITTDMFDKYFTNCETSAIDSRVYVTEDIDVKRDGVVGNVGAALKIQYTVGQDAAPVVVMNADATAWSTSNFPEWCEDFETPSTSDYTANEGIRSFYRTNFWQSAKFKYGQLDLGSSGSTGISCSVTYPVATLSIPLISGEESQDANKIEIKKDNNNRWQSYTIDTSNPIFNVKYPESLYIVDEKDGKFTFYAPEGHHIWINYVLGASGAPAKAIARAAADEPDYTTNGLTTLGYQNQESNVYVHDANATAAGTLHVATAPAIGEDGAPTNVAQYEYYGFEGDGQMSGVSDVAVDADSAVEYFNLQGIRVANPKGGVYIRRQGSKIEKVNIL